MSKIKTKVVRGHSILHFENIAISLKQNAASQGETVLANISAIIIGMKSFKDIERRNSKRVVFPKSSCLKRNRCQRFVRATAIFNLKRITKYSRVHLRYFQLMVTTSIRYKTKNVKLR